MSAIDILIDEFPGNNQWLQFVDVFREAWKQVSDQPRFAREIGNEEIAIVLNARMGHDAIAWMKQPIGALGNRSAQAVLRDHPSGEIAVKGLIMRMPM